MATGPETRLKKQFVAWVRKRESVWFFKVAGGIRQRVGIPDFLLCVNGYFLALELKAPDDTPVPTRAQRVQLEKIRAAGGGAFVVNTLADAKLAVEFLEKRPSRGASPSVDGDMSDGSEEWQRTFAGEKRRTFRRS